ncbi:LysR family transcriptional regulator [Acetobacterium tundrae]|uniref:LysR family transcriptional regulator n=1 Tax=Acetobacterium tundrae TaxID=132932 RepID=A0ABR6WI65_9FIRM|nr:LysR family transcriptional regulator [Acetobacterium tundrae]MBC3796179.1 LysR family transcriptional regulator [Acetobacterium tundrae]
MNFLQMQQFKIIAKHESIAKAADELFVTSSALSKTLKNIENEFNCTFFDRIGRKIYINQNGTVLLGYISTILNSYDNMNQYFNPNNKTTHSSIVLCDLGENILDKSISTFLQKYPYIRIKKETVSFEKSIEMLLEKKADIIFTDHLSINKYKAELTDQNIESTFLFKNKLFIAVPPESKYAALKEINLNQLENEAFVNIKGELNNIIKTAPFIDYLCQKENIKLNFAYHYDLDYAYKHLFFTSHLYLSDSLHISYYTDSRKYKKYVKIANKSAYQDIYICYRPEEANAAIFADVLKKTFMNIFKT